MVNKKATEYLCQLERINSIEEAVDKSKDYLLLPKNVELQYEDDLILTKGLGALDLKQKDLLRLIDIKNAIDMSYDKLNIFCPRTFAESDNMIQFQTHISVHAIAIFKYDTNQYTDFLKMIDETKKRDISSYDMWIDCTKKISDLKNDEVMMITNRRIGGWDGSPDNPKIELLAGGGHLATRWNSKKGQFEDDSLRETVIKECEEELGTELSENDINIIGGFYNPKTYELVGVAVVEISMKNIFEIQKKALNNLENNTDGIFVGTLKGILDTYQSKPGIFAGGKESLKFNFPSQEKLMEKFYLKLF
jgi:hypothetical protein